MSNTIGLSVCQCIKSFITVVITKPLVRFSMFAQALYVNSCIDLGMPPFNVFFGREAEYNLRPIQVPSIDESTEEKEFSVSYSVK